jgi:cytidyltransferase-like protein
MKAAYAAGRFQPPTIGHARLIQAVKDVGGQAFVFVSSANPTGIEAAKNPLTSEEKIRFLKLMFPTGVEFVDTARCKPGCGGPLGGYGYLHDRGYTDITLVAGSDRTAVFGPGAPIWKSIEDPPDFKALDRGAPGAVNRMSGTKARALAASGNLAGFTSAVMIGKMTADDAKKLYNLLRARRGGRTRRRRLHTTRKRKA